MIKLKENKLFNFDVCRHIIKVEIKNLFDVVKVTSTATFMLVPNQFMFTILKSHL